MVTSNNKTWGFFGTVKTSYGVSNTEANKLFNIAADFFLKVTDSPEDVVVRFLDSTYGRHFADTLGNYFVSHVPGYSSEDVPYETVENALKNQLSGSQRHIKEFRRFVKEIQAEDTMEFGESTSFNKLVQRVVLG